MEGMTPLTEDEVASAIGRLYLMLLRLQKELDALRAKQENAPETPGESVQ